MALLDAASPAAEAIGGPNPIDRIPRKDLLSNSGHIQSILNPPGNPKATYYANADRPAAAKDWRVGATPVTGSWWPRWLGWLAARSGELKPAPAALGNRKYAPLEPAARQLRPRVSGMAQDFHGALAVNGIPIHVDVRTAGEGPPLLLCNGIGANLELVEPLVDVLAAQSGCRIPTIRLDIPGAGGSPITRLPRRMRGLARLRGGGHLALLTHANDLVPTVHRFLSKSGI